MNEKELKEEALKGVKEFELAWQEFFKDKPEPTNDEEEKKEQEEFYHWYNYVRKQSDTGKTPVEMYKELYGKEPPQGLPISSENPSRMMNFEWDEDYEEDIDEGDEKEDELDDAQEEAVVIATKIFEDSWKRIKQEVDGASKKEMCKYSFILGFLDYMKMMDQKAEIIKKKMENMTEEDLAKMISNFKEKEDE